MDQFKPSTTGGSSTEGLYSQVESKSLGISSNESNESTESSFAVQRPNQMATKTNFTTEIQNSNQSPDSNFTVNITIPSTSLVTDPLRKPQKVTKTISKKKKLSSTDNVRSYDLTRRAALRMAGFSLGFALINFVGCINTILNVVKGATQEVSAISSNDWIGAFIGIIVFIVFGLPDRYFGQ